MWALSPSGRWQVSKEGFASLGLGFIQVEKEKGIPNRGKSMCKESKTKARHDSFYIEININ